MNANRGPVIGLIIAVIVAVFALVQQQQAVNDLRTAVTRAALADADKSTAVAMMQAASGTQVQAEIGQATAQAAAGEISTALATAQAAAGTAAVQVEDAGTRSAQLAATASAVLLNMQATATLQADSLAALQAEATDEVATLQAQLLGAATEQAYTGSLLGTATAQLDLAEFARQAAEDDRTTALNQVWALGTAQAETRRDLATAQAVLTGAPPPTLTPRPTEPQLNAEPTTVSSGDPALPNTFVSADERIRVNYPQGWFAQEFQNGSIIVVNQEDLFNRTESALTAGQVEVDILVGTYDQYGIDANTSAVELVQLIVGNIQSRQSTFEAGEVTSLTINGKDAAQMSGSDGDNDISITAVELSDTALAVVYGLTAVGEQADSFDTIMSLIATITFTE